MGVVQPMGNAACDFENEGVLVEVSARNQFTGTTTHVKVGGVMAEVVIDIGGHEIVSAITRGSFESLNLAVGDQVTAIIKSTEVILGKDM